MNGVDTRIEDIRILITDDHAAIHDDFRRILATGVEDDANLAKAENLLFGDPAATSAHHPAYALDFALQGQQAVQCVKRARADGRPYAMAFVDMRMPPGWDGLETIERLWQEDPGVQIVICSAHSDYDWKDIFERLGRSDKLLILKKPFEPIEVLQSASALSRKWQHERALEAHVKSLEQVITARTEKLEAANLQLRHLATHDSLTGLPNRVLLDDRLAQAIAHADRDAQPFAVLMLDLDRFKMINDSFGHRSGDMVLNEVARRLQGLVRSIDTVARVGGDEFVLVVSPSAARADAEEIGKRANEALRKPIQLEGVDLHVSSSIGIAFYPTDGSSAENVLAHADAAMYCAKERGRNNHQCFGPGMKSKALERVSLESELHQALRFGQFELFYLRRFPIDKLKIDRSFITDLTNRADDASIVQAIVSLAHGMRLKVVAEGVESLEQLKFLQSVGCDQYQGYHFSPPLPATEFAELVCNWQKAEDRPSADDASRTHSKLAAYR